MPQFIQHFGEMSDFIRGLVVAIILIPSAFSGIFAGSVSDRISRKRTISLGAGLFCIGMIMCKRYLSPSRFITNMTLISAVAAPTLGVLIGARCIAGVGEG